MTAGSENQYQLVDPTTEATVAAFDGAPRLPSLAGGSR